MTSTTLGLALLLGVPGDRDLDFPKLIALAERYGLPVPPTEAPLVLANLGWIDHTPVYWPAFLLESRPDGGARFLAGWESLTEGARAPERPVTRSYAHPMPVDIRGDYRIVYSHPLRVWVTAIQLAKRGKDEEAKYLWEAIGKLDEDLSDPWSGENLNRWKSSPEVFLARAIYLFLYQQFLEDVDPKSIHQRLLSLGREYPDIFQGGVHGDARVKFVEDLGITASLPSALPGSTEALLLELGRAKRLGSCEHLFTQDWRECREPALEIFRKGRGALSMLDALKTDRRITWLARSEIRGPSDNYLRLGELAERLRNLMKGSFASIGGAASRSSPGTDQEFFEEAAFDRDGGRIKKLYPVPLWILGQSYPGSLKKVCAQVPDGIAPELPLADLAGQVALSSLPLEQKASILEGMAERLGKDHRLPEVQRELEGLGK